ncbi:MAG: glycine zipper 2TM domain-containing protein [Alphaproteobacteria bacterium]|nr:glycine zipper 2TM domain-containing protein [Alphaproteobacteria bacterium]MBV9371232.1 glycine zipper 2TM domain-containing protein [Alphaproteobacteria bacterium]MBV9902829.1 glycine zipper 2TM domain-containing protein [Alphaproteobacteria bacterium]
MRKLILALSAASLTVPAVALPSAAEARGVGTYHGKVWRGSNGRTYCRKPSGTTGLVVGGAAGVLAGRQIDKHGDRTTGTVLGAAIGALLGRTIERDVVSRCR